MALQRGIVKLEDYNPNWENEYKKEEELLKSVLKDKIIEMHHVGSTSIPGLKAKPIIDILIVIKSLNEIPCIEELLKPYSYENRGEQGVIGRIFFAKGPDNARSHYIHFTTMNSETYFNQLYFKKYLLSHPDYIKEYNDLKVSLANKYANERKLYTQGKDEFIKNIIKHAKEEFDK